MPQEMQRIDAVMTHQAEQGGAIAQPVLLAQTDGLLLVDLQVPTDVVDHRPVDVRKDVPAGVVQRIVKVEQPDWSVRHQIASNAVLINESSEEQPIRAVALSRPSAGFGPTSELVFGPFRRLMPYSFLIKSVTRCWHAPESQNMILPISHNPARTKNQLSFVELS